MTDDLEERLRAHAEHWRQQQPDPNPAALPAAMAARSNRGHHLWVVAAAAAVIIAVAGTVSAVSLARGSAHQPADRPSTVVPWNAEGQVPATSLVPAAPVVRAPTGTRTCQDRDLTVAAASTRPAPERAGWLRTQYTLRYTGVTACEVDPDGIQSDILDRNNLSLPNDEGLPSRPPVFVGFLLLRPGQYLRSALTWFWNKNATNRPDHVDLQPIIGFFGQSGITELSIDVSTVTYPASRVSPTTGRPFSPTLWRAGWMSDPVEVADPDPLLLLSVTLTAPATVRLGTPASYAVTITNPTDGPISLADCPRVTQIITVTPSKEPISTGTRGPMNCAPLGHTISAHQTVTFEFEIATTGLPSGNARISWQLNRAGRPLITAQSSPLATTN